MPFVLPLRCPWRCYEIGGPWISENPSCPFHGRERIPYDPETGAYDIDAEDAQRMCAEERERNEPPG